MGFGFLEGDDKTGSSPGGGAHGRDLVVHPKAELGG